MNGVTSRSQQLGSFNRVLLALFGKHFRAGEPHARTGCDTQ
jgi:hypothetical protein